MVLANVDKLAKENNGVKYLLIRQDRFDRTVDAKGMKTKDSKETVRACLSKITKKNRPKTIWVDKGTEFAGEFEKLCKAEGIQIYSTMSECVKPRLPLLNVQKDPWKIYFSVTWETMDTSTFTNWLNSIQN